MEGIASVGALATRLRDAVPDLTKPSRPFLLKSWPLATGKACNVARALNIQPCSRE
jgi:hypothetical protein